MIFVDDTKRLHDLCIIAFVGRDWSVVSYVRMRNSPKPKKCKYSAATRHSSSRGKSTAGDSGGYAPTAAALTCGGNNDCGD